MAMLLYRLGKFAARRRWRVIGAWIFLALAIIFANVRFGSEPSDEFEIGGVESIEAFERLGDTFQQEAGARVLVVFATDQGRLDRGESSLAIDAALDQLRGVEDVNMVVSPFARGPAGISPDADVAVAELRMGLDASRGPPDVDVDTLRRAVAPAEEAGLQVEFGGDVNTGPEEPGGTAEAVGLLVAIIVLLVAFGSVVAMSLPIVMAMLGIVLGLSVVLLLADVLQVNTITPVIATMIGLAVGIDYSLFVVSRFRQHLHMGASVEESVGRANATAGQAVIVAGVTVMISITGLVLVGLPFVTGLGLATAVVVGMAVLLAVTLLPALLGLLGPRVDRLKVPGLKLQIEGTEAESRTWSARWARAVNRRALPWFVAGLALLLLLAVPALSMRLGFADAGSSPPDSTSRKAYDLISDGFGPGFNGPLLVVAALDGVDPQEAQALAAELRELDGVELVSPAIPSPDGRTAIVQVVPTTGPQDAETEQLVERIRSDVAPRIEQDTGMDVLVSGTTAVFIDITDRLSSRIAVFVVAVLLLSIVLLTVVFRSVVVPLKAAFLNLLAIGAAYGVIVAVFQWGWLRSVVGLGETIPIAPFVPMMMFAILFGLSMDYEVFILSRVREEWLLHHDPNGSVIEGLAKSARVVTAAATIMVAVFGSFIQRDDPTIKLFGLGLAVAVALDATVVRMVLVPSFMQLLGARNWWMPRWLDRIMPRVDIEGESALPPLDGVWVPIEQAAGAVGVSKRTIEVWLHTGIVQGRGSGNGDGRYDSVLMSDVESAAQRARARAKDLRDRIDALESRATKLEVEAASLREEAKAVRELVPDAKPKRTKAKA